MCFSLVSREVASRKAGCTGRRECAAGGGGSAQSGSVSCCSLCCFSAAVYHHWGLPPRLTELGGRAAPAISGRYQRLHLRVHRWGTGRCINWPSPSRLNGASAAHDSAREAQQPFAPPALESQHNDCPIAQSHQRWRGNAAAPVRMALHPPSPPVPAASLRHRSNN